MSKRAIAGERSRVLGHLQNKIRAVPGWWAVNVGTGSDQRCWCWRWVKPETGTVIVSTWDEFRILRAKVEAECGPAPAGLMPSRSRRLPPPPSQPPLEQLKLPI